MKSFALFAAICAVALSAEGTKTANATTIHKYHQLHSKWFSCRCSGCFGDRVVHHHIGPDGIRSTTRGHGHVEQHKFQSGLFPAFV